MKKPYNRPGGRGNATPFGGWRHHLSPAGGGTITRAYCSATYEGTAFQSFIVPPLSGGKVVP